MDSKLKCVFVLPNEEGSSGAGPAADVGNAKTDNYASVKQPIPPSPKVSSGSPPPPIRYYLNKLQDEK